MMARKARSCGADFVKFQAFIPDSITIPVKNEYFKYKNTYLYDLYKSIYLTREDQESFIRFCKNEGIRVFGTVYCKDDVDFLERFDLPYYKISSFEASDLDFIECVASRGKPLIISLGCLYDDLYGKVIDIVKILDRYGVKNESYLLHCVSKYPCDISELNFSAITKLKETLLNRFPSKNIGLSDHYPGIESAAIAAYMKLGMVEKHFTLNKEAIDGEYSLLPKEFKKMVSTVKSIIINDSGKLVQYHGLARSIFAVQDISRGQIFTEENIRIIRPGNGLAPDKYREILGKKCMKGIRAGTPLLIENILTQDIIQK